MLNFIAQEERVPLVREVVHEGRRTHLEWVECYCAPLLEGTDAAEREELVHAAIAVTDLCTWKLLRRDRGLDPEGVHAVMMRMLIGLKRR